MIIFVGDKPSKHNISKDVAFVGTKSYKTLLSWIYNLNLDITDCIICNKDQVKTYGYIENCYVETSSTFCDIIIEDKIIALGNNASNYLKNLKINHFKLPHPSGLNRLNNNKELIKSKLKECGLWLQS